VPEVHVPHLDEHDEEHAPPASAAPQPRARSKGLLKLALEVLLIGTGVFLGLAGEQWRESREHRERAEASLRRFSTELGDNKKTVAAVLDYHAALRANLKQYFDAPPRKRNSISVKMQGIRPALFETTAWDLAIATQSLSYLDGDLAYALSPEPEKGRFELRFSNTNKTGFFLPDPNDITDTRERSLPSSVFRWPK